MDVELERYELFEQRRYDFALSRREFFGVAGVGLLFTATHTAALAQSSANSVAARLYIAADGRITVMTGKVEVGQGSRTQITQAAAEELQVPVDQIRLIMADTDLTPDDGGTAGSRTTPSTVPAVRRAAAAARQILLEMARERGTTLSYAELVQLPGAAMRFQEAIPADVSLTPTRDWKVLGTPVPHPGGREIVTGAHRYASDIVRPNMLYGRVLRPPSYGATLAEIDLSPARDAGRGCGARWRFHRVRRTGVAPRGAGGGCDRQNRVLEPAAPPFQQGSVCLPPSKRAARGSGARPRARFARRGPLRRDEGS